MHQSSLEYLRCVNCSSGLSLYPLVRKEEIDEGFLRCIQCAKQYPIISSIPFIVDDFSSHLSIRTRLGGDLLLIAKSDKIRSYLKENLRKIKNGKNDTTKLEKNWVQIYKHSTRSNFYRHIFDVIRNLPKCNLVLEHGCSIGHVSKEIAHKSDHVFGIDRSFYAILEAKKRNLENSDFVVADSLNHPFAGAKFDMVVALNVLDIIEPLELLKVVTSQTRSFLILSDPYDFERGKDSVKTKIDANKLRLNLLHKGFKLIQNTKHPRYIPWKLNVNERLHLNYKVDLIVAKKL